MAIFGFPNVSDSKVCLHCRRSEFNPWVRKTPREGNDKPLQYSFQGKFHRAYWARVHRVVKSQTHLETKTHTNMAILLKESCFIFIFWLLLDLRHCAAPLLLHTLNIYINLQGSFPWWLIC